VLDDTSVTELPVGDLKLDGSARLDGPREEHLRQLAKLDDELPPIVVQVPSMRVLDGVHRVHIAVMRQLPVIKARLFRGSDDDAFVLAVRLNIAHGLPLTAAERTAAAEKIIRSHPRWSNRMIARVAGLSATTVASIRKRSTGQIDRSNTRIGLDGRARPVNGDDGRRRVVELLARKPEASIRAIAREAGVAPSTVHGVRKGMVAPVPKPLIESAQPFEPRFNITDTIEVLAKDPSLRLTDTGRRIIRLLSRSSVDCTEYSSLVERIPEHCVVTAAKLARRFADEWVLVAEHLEKRVRYQSS
jgi:hypothetical protein